MKFKISILIASLIAISPVTSYAQWTTGSGIITTLNNVGIGTYNPTAPLTIGNGLNQSNLTVAVVNTSNVNINALTLSNWIGYAASYGPRINFDNSGRGAWYIGGADGTNSFDIARSWGTPDLRLAPNGYVGLGTSTPTVPLTIGNGNNLTGSAIVAINTANSDKNALILSNWVGSATSRGPKIAFDNSTFGNWYVGGADGTNNFDIARTWGSPDFRVTANGNVGVGTSIPDAKLTVKGTIHASEVKVDLNVPGPDYVFETNYTLPELKIIENYITKNRHLPEVPSAKEMEKNGMNLSEMNLLLLKKVEELTLYLIGKDKELKQQRQIIQSQNKRLETVEKKLKSIIR